MKKPLYIVIVAILLFTAAAACACSDKTPDAISSKYENLAADGSFTVDGGAAGDSAVFGFGKTVTFNTVVLKEKGDSVTSFRIYADDGEVPIYGNDFIGGYRFCSFAETKADKIRLEVLAADGEWKLEDVEAYLITGKAEDFAVMSYINADTAYLLSEDLLEAARVVTQFNVFGCAHFDAKGEIILVDYEINGEKVSGAEIMRGAVENIRKANPAATVVATVLGNKDFGDGLTTVGRHNEAMGNNSAALTANLLKFINEYGLDGVSFDYEYPEKKKDFDIFTDYLKELDKALGSGKLLTAAISDWCVRTFGYSAKDFEVLDSIELMAYDMFDERGNHSSFYGSCYSILKNMEKKGVDMSKVNLGLPFYSRPLNGDSFWGSYRDVADRLSPYENSIEQEYTNLDGVAKPATLNYYNGRQLIYDKTRFAIACGAGGVMIWHFGCDSFDAELSLFSQIDAAVNGEYIIK